MIIGLTDQKFPATEVLAPKLSLKIEPKTPVKESKKEASCGHHGQKHGRNTALFPMEYFIMTRMRQNALASRFGGSLEVEDVQPIKIQTNPTTKDDLSTVIENLGDLKIEEKTPKAEEKPTVEDEAAHKLVPRGPVFQCNRMSYRPYGVRAQPHQITSGGVQMVPQEYQTTYQATPEQFINSQRAKQNQFVQEGQYIQSYTVQEFENPQFLLPMESYDQNDLGQGQNPVVDTSPQHSIPSPPDSFSPGSAPDLGPRPSPRYGALGNGIKIGMDNFTADLSQFLTRNSELPDELTDFILQYSRRYSVDTPSSGSGGPSSNNSLSSTPERKHSADLSSGISSPAVSFVSRNSCSPPSVFSDQSSPVSIGKNSPTSSPPRQQTRRRVTPLDNRVKSKGSRGQQGSGSRRSTKARDKLRSMIDDEDFERGWAWAAKCWHAAPQTLYFLRDTDGDTFLHRVVYHKDLAKIYGLVEHMLKDENPLCPKAYDLPNSNNESPLFVAVQRRLEDIVSYLLECGAHPNILTRDRSGDAPLHYAAARGMAEIVSALANCPRTDVDLYNAQGLTPLLCAVKYHGVIEEESQCLVNNKPCIRALIAAGAEAKIPEASHLRKTVLHYAVERMDPDLVQIFYDNLPPEEMKVLVNTPSIDGNTPLHTLSQMPDPRSRLLSGPHTLARGEEEDELRRKMFFTLIECGADTNRVNQDGQYPVVLCGSKELGQFQ